MSDLAASPEADTRASAPPTAAAPASVVPRDEVSGVSGSEQEPSPSPAVCTLKRPRAGEPVTHFLSPASCGVPSPSSTDTAAPPLSSAEAPGVNEHRGAEEGVAVPPKHPRLDSAASSLTPRSPYANLPRKVPRKTPVSTPTSSVVSPSLPSPAALVSPLTTPPQASPTGVTPAAVRLAALHQRWATMLHAVLLKERQPHEAEAVMSLSLRIIEALPGDAEERKDGFQTILLNMKDAKNGELRRRVVEGELLVEQLVRMDDRELANPELRQQIEETMEVRAKNTNMSELAKAMRTSHSTLFKCKACGARDTSWYQRQTRSGDEPMTVIITCNKCGVQWRQY